MSFHPDPLVFLKLEGLKTYFDTEQGVIKAVDGVDFEILGGDTLGVVGESGCGKSVTALSIMRLFPSPPGRIAGGKIWFKGQELTPSQQEGDALHPGRPDQHDLPGTHDLAKPGLFRG